MKDFAPAARMQIKSSQAPALCLKGIFNVAKPYHTVPYGTDHGIARIQALRARLLSPIPYGKPHISGFATQ